MLKCITRAKVPASLPDYQSSLLLALSGHCSDTAQSPLSEADNQEGREKLVRVFTTSGDGDGRNATSSDDDGDNTCSEPSNENRSR